MDIAYIENILFMNKQNIPWSQVEQYLKQYVGKNYIVEESKDSIYIGYDFPEEFAESRYTKSLRGNMAKAKANASQVVGKMVVIATNRRWTENKADKHAKDAEQGWYRYDSYFAMPVQGSDEKGKRINIYKATLVVKKSIKGLYLYDIINIKKEASTPLESIKTVR
ncbi:MAG: hypothetical protein J6C64_08000 [Lachnospiraceae bacterium]|nr:hypothetical protein [Lachnospiraceae bacterium]